MPGRGEPRLRLRRRVLGSEVTLWALEPEVVASINEQGVNEMFLPGVKLPNTLHAVNDLAAMVMQDALLMVAPAQFVRGTCERLAAAGFGRLSTYSYLQQRDRTTELEVDERSYRGTFPQSVGGAEWTPPLR